MIYYLSSEMSKRKIINDPIYGLVHFPFDQLYDLIDHPHFQRLRRISQMGLSNYVYPGATHSRFAHALGALHLMTTAIETLRNKGIEISDDEYLATCIAILLHDVGHGPFSHALEHLIVDKAHEDISLDIMRSFEENLPVHIDMAIRIFEGKYQKKFLTQLVSSQLDMDRMDYLTRDSYYSGVAEGVIGYKRIIAMLNVSDNKLVVEEKGLYSIEKFLFARHIMYWQVYLHKASVCIEQILKSYVVRLKNLLSNNQIKSNGSKLHGLLSQASIEDNYLEKFLELDDIDIFSEIKQAHLYEDRILRFLARSILNRNLFVIQISDAPFSKEAKEEIIQKVSTKHDLDKKLVEELIIEGKESNKVYDINKEQILLMRKSGEVVPASKLMDITIGHQTITKYFICYPR